MSKGNNIGIFTLPSLHSWAIGNGPVVQCFCVWQQQRQHLVSAAHRRPFLSNPLHGRERPCRGEQHHGVGRGWSWSLLLQICCHFHHHLQRSVNRNNSNWRVSNRKVQRPCRRCDLPPHRRFVSLHPRPRRRETYHIMFFFAKESVFIFIFMSCVVMTDAIPFSAT